MGIAVGLVMALAGLGCLYVMGTGIGLSGPEQDFSLRQGETATSHLIVWNEGSGAETFSATVTGNVSALVTISPGSLSVGAGASGRVTVSYSVPSDQEPGSYSGRIWVSVSGSGVVPSVSRAVSIVVTGASTKQMPIRKGLNLASWMGPTGTLDSSVPRGQGLYKIWKRKSDGTYVSSQFYAESGVWWSSDQSFTTLETGRAYFFESTADATLQVAAGTLPSSIHLSAGLNLVGWPYASKSLEQVFPQGPQNYAVTKVWRRLPNGSYSFAQYYPESNVWWSSDAGFVSLETGCAYFIEATRGVDIVP